MLRDILVHVDGLAENSARVALACAVAREHGAHLAGVVVIHRPEVPGYARAQIGEKVLAAVAEAARVDAEAAGRKFREQCDKAGVTAESRVDKGDLVETLAMHARYADLAVIGQNIGDDTSEIGIADRLILNAARPVLVVPSAGKFATVGETAMIAWDAGRPATRAVNDALPILKKAKKVHIVAADPLRGLHRHGQVPGADIGLHLARHGVKAEVSTLTLGNDIDVGNALLSRAADFGADLIVMGAYGHARLRELVLGGVTRLMLREMTVPVLMSH